MSVKRKALGSFTLLFLLIATNAFKQTGAPPKQACENAKTQPEMNQCAAAAYQAADQKLNTVYTSVKGKLDADLQEKLQIA